MKKAVGLILFFILISSSYVTASYIEVTAFIFDPEEPSPGEPVTILVRLANKNYDQDYTVTCRLFVDGILHDVKIVPVERRSSTSVSFRWYAEVGAHVFSLEMSYFADRTETTTAASREIFLPGEEPEIDFYLEAQNLFSAGSYLQAKIMFEQAKRLFEEEQDIEKALSCEEYILTCDRYLEANRLFSQAEEAYQQDNLPLALTYYQQAQFIYEDLGDQRATTCQEKIDEIYTTPQSRNEFPYYILLLIPVAAALIAVVYLARKKPPPPLPSYVPEKKIETRLFQEEDVGRRPEIYRELRKIENHIDTDDPQAFKSLVEDFKKQEIHFDKTDFDPEEAEYLEKNIGKLKHRLKTKGKTLQDTQKLHDLKKRCEILLAEPVGDLVDAYNRYAQLQNSFDQISYLGTPEQEEVKSKLKEYYEFIQREAKTRQSEPR
ncbi:MAG: hypothetical protein HXS53_03790 [Theionarchaea archaeon]|nr:hypothetical protein [Theionarchaea archaeon]